MIDKLNDLLEKHGFARTAESTEGWLMAVLEHPIELNVCDYVAIAISPEGTVEILAPEWEPIGRRHAELLLDVFEMVKES